MEIEVRRLGREHYEVELVALGRDRPRVLGHARSHGSLEQLSAHIESELRASDAPAEELMLVLVRAEPESAEPALARLRRSLAGVGIGPARPDPADSAGGGAEYTRHAAGRPG